MTPKYDVGDIVYSFFNKQNFMVVERYMSQDPVLLTHKYNLLSLDTGKYMIYCCVDMDNNSKLVA